MDDGLPPGLLKKLALVVLFLIGVVILVGGENDPGVIARLSDAPPGQGEFADRAPEPLIDTDVPARREQRPSQDDAALSAWYAEDAPTGPATPEPFVPEPFDDSYLIEDAEPLVGARPSPLPGPPARDATPVEIVK